ncbi:MAG: adenylate/guanylate cyclase domain-containing protein [Ignavibacterium sp.]|nr:MAG: adenylate/guanylate cyclase domain-containing protein [Ignavibacterium sp.]
MRKTQFYKILFLIIFWVCCAIFSVFYDASLLGFTSEVEGEYYSFSRVLISSIITTIIGASILGSLEVLFFGRILRKKPLGVAILVKTIIYIAFILFFVSITRMYLASAEIGKSMFSADVLALHYDFLFSIRVVMNIIFWGIACGLAIFILHVSDKFGQGVLLNFILGKYHHPKEEKRIFMFMDLKSSTTYAEKLGHIEYSKLIQDCFFDLTDVVANNYANIYQYVGDEAVLSWEFDKGLKNNNCINVYYDYMNVIRGKSNYYDNKYGMIPEFKAGASSGYATVAEVGELKKELAYHGDVLNTASRIQGVCNKYNKSLLISEELEKNLKLDKNFKKELIGSIELKGKLQLVNIYSIEQI